MFAVQSIRFSFLFRVNNMIFYNPLIYKFRENVEVILTILGALFWFIGKKNTKNEQA